MKHLLLSCGIWLFSIFAVCAQTISEIQVQSTGDQPISEEVVFANMKMRVGDQFSQEKLSADIKQLYNTNQFSNITPKKDVLEDGTVRLLLTFEPKWTIRQIVLQGNKNISEKRILGELKLQAGDPLDDTILSQDLAALYKLYTDKGYTDVVIDQKPVRLEGTNEANLVYSFEERRRAKTRGVDIVGNHALSDRQVRRVMETDVSFWGYLLFPTGYFNPEVFEEDLDRITELYWDRGYLDVQVSAPPVRYSDNEKKAFVTVEVVEGEPYIVSDVTFSGFEQFTEEELRPLIKTRSGDTYSRARELEDAQALEEHYNHLGYLQARVNASRNANSQTHTAAIAYSIDEGVIATIRNIEISGNTITYDNVIRREMSIHPGDLGDMTKIRASRRRLQNLGYFSKVDVVPVPTDDPSFYDLHINVEEGQTGQFGMGVGFSSAADAFATFNLTQSNFALDNPSNFFRGGGQRLSFSTTIGTESQLFNLNFTEPWLFDRRLRLDWSLWLREASYSRGWDEDSVGTSAKLTHQLPWQFWKQSVGYRLEQVDINDIDEDFSAFFFEENEGEEIVSALFWGVSRENVDRYPVPNFGSQLSMSLELQGEAIGSYSNIYSFGLRGAQYLPVFKDSVIKIEGRFDQIDAFSGDEPKVFDRLFAGGLNTLRGFKEREVGPFDPSNEEAIGGQSRVLASIELLKPLYRETLYGAIWTDAGDVWGEAWEVHTDEINVGSGVGIRLFIPVPGGNIPLRIDYGWPIVREQENLSSSGRLHFTLGYRF